MLRQGRFRHQLFSSTELKLLGNSMYKTWQSLLQKIPLHELHPAEIAGLYLFVLNSWRRPKDFLGGPHHENKSYAVKGQLAVDSVVPFLHPETTLNKEKLGANFLATLTGSSLRSIPHSAIKSLSLWHQGHYPLLLLNYIPSPLEVLTLQSQGQRLVSLLSEPQHFQDYVETERDMLGFLVHDLIHADHFFNNPENATLQIKFSKLMLKFYQAPWFKNLLESDPVFCDEFFYIASDMNSVPLHLFQTFKAMWLNHFKRRFNVSLTQALKYEEELLWQEELRHSLEAFNWSQVSISAFLRLNSERFSRSEDYLHLIDQL